MWSRVLVFAALSLLAAPSLAAVTLDAVTYAQCDSCGSLSFSHVTAAGSDRGMAVGSAGFEAAACCDDITGVTYNSVSLAQACTYETSPSTPRKIVEWWALPAPTVGSNTVAVSVTGSMSNISAGAITASGVHQTAPLSACVTATGNSTTPSVVVTSVTGDLVLDVGVIDHTGTLAVGGGQTQRWNEVGGGGFVKNFGSTASGAASVTMDWLNSIGAPNWIVAGVSLRQVSGGAAMTPRLTLLGVGP